MFNCIPDLWMISTIRLIKFVSSRSANLKYSAPPIIDTINLDFRILQASRRMCSTFSTGVSRANRAN